MRALLPLEFHPDSSVCVLGNFIFFYSGSSATLSPWRSGESYRSKDQREDPLTCSTEVNQTKRGNKIGTELPVVSEIRLRTDSRLFRKERKEERKDRN